jgi:hypothetical protein
LIVEAVALDRELDAYLIILKSGKGFFRFLLAFSLPRGEGSLTYGFRAWREAKGLDFHYD